MIDIVVGVLLGTAWIALVTTMVLAARADIRAWSRDYDIRKAADSDGLQAATAKARKSKWTYRSGAWF